MTMARYIDADKMRQEWLEHGENEYVYDTNAVLDSIDAQPTADVAPRSEVAREIFAEMGATAFTIHDDDSGEFILCMYCEDFEEIKQKYTEEQK